MTADAERRAAAVPGFLGRVLGRASTPVGTCFQVAPGVVVTAWSVLDEAGAGTEGAPVTVDLLIGGGTTTGRTVRVDPLRDLAVILTDRPFPSSVAGFAATDTVRAAEAVLATGVMYTDEARRGIRVLDASGIWEGGVTREDHVPLGRVRVTPVGRWMAGTAIRRGANDMVVGVVSGRYNASDGWLPDAAWVARVEDLLPLLDGLTGLLVHDVWPDPRAVAVTLAVDDARVRLLAPGVDVGCPHDGVPPLLARQVDSLRQIRARSVASRGDPVRDLRPAAAPRAAMGQLLADTFLPAPVDAALADVLRQADARHAAVRLGIRVTGELARLPWEMLRLPGTGQPLALHDLTRAYRQVDARPVTLSAGPLRILIAISAPLSGGGAVLDYERELRNVLVAVRGARASRAQVRIVHFATTAGIREALEDSPAHVLHLSGHGRPGMLELEDDNGDARLVTAEQFVAEAVPPGRMPPVIALAACHTDAAAATGDPSFAAALIARGAGVVIATETSITDAYAVRVFARVYARLSAERDADVVAAVADARVAVQRELLDSIDDRDQRLAALDEWSVLTSQMVRLRVRTVHRPGPRRRGTHRCPRAARPGPHPPAPHHRPDPHRQDRRRSGPAARQDLPGPQKPGRKHHHPPHALATCDSRPSNPRGCRSASGGTDTPDPQHHRGPGADHEPTTPAHPCPAGPSGIPPTRDSHTTTRSTSTPTKPFVGFQRRSTKWADYDEAQATRREAEALMDDD